MTASSFVCCRGASPIGVPSPPRYAAGMQSCRIKARLSSATRTWPQDQEPPPLPPSLPYRLSRRRAILTQRIHQFDPLCCPWCGGTVKIIAFIEARQVHLTHKIHQDCGLWQEPKPRQPPRPHHCRRPAPGRADHSALPSALRRQNTSPPSSSNTLTGRPKPSNSTCPESNADVWPAAILTPMPQKRPKMHCSVRLAPGNAKCRRRRRRHFPL